MPVDGEHARAPAWRWIEGWYWPYALVGLVKSGLVQVLVPLTVRSVGLNTEAGVVIAAFYLGGMTAPLWGELADHYRAHRLLLAAGFVSTGLALLLFATTNSLPLWIMAMFVANTGGTMVTTVANLLVVDAHSKHEWDQRIGWLQTFFGLGQVAGLLAAALFAARSDVADYRLGLGLGGLLVASGAIPGWRMTRTPPKASQPRPVMAQSMQTLDSSGATSVPSVHTAGAGMAGPLHRLVFSRFGLLMLVLLLQAGGAALFYSLYPLLMKDLFRMHPSITSVTYAVAASINLGLYAVVGNWSHRVGALRVLHFGYLVRTLAFALMWVLALAAGSRLDWFALPAFMAVVLAWSAIGIASTMLTVKLAPAGRGEALGIYNAASSAAGAAGSVASGVLADAAGFGTVLLAATGMVATALGLSFAVRPKPESADDQG
jgi:DHA1 family tetracycline resistance protein-like MFS transporter